MSFERAFQSFGTVATNVLSPRVTRVLQFDGLSSCSLLDLKRKFRYKRSVARPLTASVVNQPPSRADLIVRAGSYLLFSGNRCCKFSSTGAQNYAMSWQTQVNTKLKFSTRYAFSKFQTQTVNKPFTYNNILRLDDCHHTFSLIPPDYFRNRWRTETEWVSCIH